MSTEPTAGKLKPNQLGVPSIVFLVLAAVAPLTVAIVVMPMIIGLGNGGGAPVAVIAVGLALLLFAVGYAQMTKQLTNTGGFYAIAVRGLGRAAGLVTGLIATFGYNFFVAGGIGTMGFFTGLVVFPALFGFEIPWIVPGLVLFLIAFLLARSGIQVSAIVLGIALILETIIIAAFVISVLINTGFSFEAFTTAFAPEYIVGGTIWIAFLLVATAFIGFEATSLFSEEARDPKRTIPRATFWAIIIIAVMHALLAWAIVSAIGVSDAKTVAQDSLAAGDLTIGLIYGYLGDFIGIIVLVLLVVSMFAAQLAFHNSAGRYLYALGRARVLPKWLAATNKNGAPGRALAVNFVFATIIALVFAIFPESDGAGGVLPPVVTLVPVGIGFGTLAVLIVQAIAALAIVVHFRRTRDPRWWSTFIAPGIGFLALLTFSIMAIFNFTLVAGSEAVYVQLLPWILVLALVGGIVYALYLRSSKPQVYEGLKADLEKFEELR